MRIAIIGGGASGMLLASMLNGLDVTIYEKNSVLGKKLSLTGNGKCNFTNADFTNLTDCYNNDFARAIVKRFNNDSFCKYFSSIGIIPKIEVHKGISYFYPNSNSARSVIDSLLQKINANNIKINLNTNIIDINRDENGFIVKTNFCDERFDVVVIATGGLSYKNTGSSGSGYSFFTNMSINKLIEPIPGLCALKLDIKNFNDLKGVRVDANVSAMYDGKCIYEEFGEIQFSESYISGIPILNISRYVDRLVDEGKSVYIVLNFCKNIFGIKNCSSDEYNFVIDYLTNLQKNTYYKKSYEFLSGLLPQKLSNFLLRGIAKEDLYVSDFTANDLQLISSKLIGFKAQVIGNAGFDNAQITLGGIDTNNININTMESIAINKLYYIGEVLDIDGKCGGYNLQLCYSTASIVANSLLKE